MRFFRCFQLFQCSNIPISSDHRFAAEGGEQKQERKAKSRDMGLKEDFEEHAELAKTLPESTTNAEKLILYGLYKQATVGPVSTGRPGMFSQKERAKWDAWHVVKGKSAEEAMGDYITKVKQLKEAAASC